MKLEEYAIKDALKREDWDAAVSAVAAHFGLCCANGYTLDLLRQPYIEPEVEIAQAGMTYSWRVSRGFASWPNSRQEPGIDTVVAVVCSPMPDPAGPKAGAARS